MLAFLIGFAAIVLGAKAFSVGGLPVTKTKKMKGTPAIVVGIFCILLGLVFVAVGVFSLVVMAGRR